MRKIYADALIAEGVVTPEEVERELADAQELLTEAHEDVKMREGEPTGEKAAARPHARATSPTPPYPLERLRGPQPAALRDAARASTSTASSRPQREKRAEVGPDDPIDWGQAEALALRPLLIAGRAAPAHRPGHACAARSASATSVLVDVETGARYAPIQHLDGAKAPFELHNSPLSEAGALGFEYGYGVAGAGRAGDVGGAVRRLRQRRAR